VTAADRIRTLVLRADDRLKAAANRPDPEAASEGIAALLHEARDLLDQVEDEETRLELAAGLARRFADLDRAGLPALLVPSEGVARAPTDVDDPRRVPPGQRLTPGWPVLHVGSAPDTAPADWRLVITGRVGRRTVLTIDELAAVATVRITSDLHCVTGWSRLDNTWEGVRVADVLDLAEPRAEATHVVVAGRPAYTANLPLADLRRDDVLLAWGHDGRPLSREHGGPLRLVIPHRYGWKSVKWVEELRLLDRDVRGYWEERGYHDRGDPWHEERFRL
jgi:DMSO/TMAO reductase YedYZ molybdopterin-dependent catalytic subunit